MIWVRGDMADVQALARRGDVAHIYANPAVHVDEPLRGPADAAGPQAAAQPDAIEWNITKVGAPEVWAAGFTGQGVVIGGQDTGYQWDHPALKGKYRGWNGSTANHDYSWHDAIHVTGSSCGADSLFPCDDHGHGTHTMGTMVGDDGAGNQIGMAPGAKWIGCRNMNSGCGHAGHLRRMLPVVHRADQGGRQRARPVEGARRHQQLMELPADEGCTDPNVLLAVVQATGRHDDVHGFGAAWGADSDMTSNRSLMALREMHSASARSS